MELQFCQARLRELTQLVHLHGNVMHETFSQLVDSVLEGYNGELTIIITCKRKQTKHTLFQQAMYILGHFFYISSPSGDRTAFLCGHLRQIIF